MPYTLISYTRHSPPYSADVANYILYDAVNTAWRNSYYNTSKACITSHTTAAAAAAAAAATKTRMKDRGEDDTCNLESGSGSEGKDRPVTGYWKCPVCTSDIRLLSISGGRPYTLILSVFCLQLS